MGSLRSLLVAIGFTVIIILLIYGRIFNSR